MIRIALLLLLSLLLAGCGHQTAAPEMLPTTVTEAAESVPETTVSAEEEAAALALPPTPAVPVILECQAPGIQEKRSEDAVIDYSNAAEGYVMVNFTGVCNTRLKVRVAGPDTTYTYNLPVGEWTVFPLSDGNGTYKVTVYRNTSGSRYAAVMSAGMDVVLEEEFAPFLRPNQYVDYASAPETMALGETLCTGLDTPLEKVAAVYDYVVDQFRYDDEKAASVKSGYLPVLDTVLAEKKGICFDYAAVMTAILRSQQVPCKLVVGYAGSAYHAWISVWTEENGWVDGVIFFDGQSWKRMDPTFASSSQRSEEILDFIEHGTYTVKYLY